MKIENVMFIMGVIRGNLVKAEIAHMRVLFSF